MEEIGNAYVIDFAERSAADWIFKFIDQVDIQKEGLVKAEKEVDEELEKFKIGK